jgi:hypothetical protein
MTPAADTCRRLLRPAACFLLGAAVFAAAYCQAPLYYSNQNQYFLHGLAGAGWGLLREDWLANTHDPTPVFSALVSSTARHLHPGAFYAYYALLMGAYAAAMLGLFASVAGEQAAARRWPVFVALFLAAHSALPRWCSYHWLGQDYPWFLQAGVANQYVLGPSFQPSVFGVLLVAAVCLFVRGRPFLAAACAALAATVHATYLLPAGLLTAAFLYVLVREGRPRKALSLGLWGLVLVLPVTAYTLVTFRPTSPEVFRKAQHVLVSVRIPHHTQPRLWCDPIALGQVAWVVLGTTLAGGRLRAVLAVSGLLALALTLVQVATGSDTLALLFPWRLSAVLVPIATTVVLARLAAAPILRLDGPAARVASAVVVAALVAGGIGISVNRLGFSSSDEEVPMLNFMRQHKAAGGVYLIPVSVPDLARTTKGSPSSDFKPMPDKRQDKRVIPYDLQRFRLYTGAPIWIDFKAIPYKDTEVLEWLDRLRVAQGLQEQVRAGDLPGAVSEMHRRGITHLVLPAGDAPHGEGLEAVYQDEHYRVYRLAPGPAGGG